MKAIQNRGEIKAIKKYTHDNENTHIMIIKLQIKDLTK